MRKGTQAFISVLSLGVVAAGYQAGQAVVVNTFAASAAPSQAGSAAPAASPTASQTAAETAAPAAEAPVAATSTTPAAARLACHTQQANRYSCTACQAQIGIVTVSPNQTMIHL